MAQPAAFNRTSSFTNLQAASPSSPLPGNLVDAEFNNAKTTFDQILQNLRLIQRDDGALIDGSVGRSQLSAELTVGFSAPTAWKTATNYVQSPASTVFYGGKFYSCNVSHASGVFATDLNSSKWTLIADLTTIPIQTASQVSFIAGGGLSSVDVQAALVELGSGKAALVHTHVATDITDSTALGRSLLSATSADAVLSTINGFSTGDVKLTIKTAADTGWVMMNDGTIGSATSGATYANVLALNLYLLLWNNISDTYAPVTTGRGATAALDWAANKPIALTAVLGRALGIAGAGSGLTSRALGLATGAETTVLSTANLPVITPAGTVAITDPGHAHNIIGFEGTASVSNAATGNSANTPHTGVTQSTTTGITAAFTGTPFGSGTAHTNMQPTSFFNAMIKL